MFKKTFYGYAITWVIMVALFNVLCFIIPDNPAREEAPYWIGYAFIHVAFLILLGAVAYALYTKIDNAYFRLPIVKRCYTSLAIMGIVGGLIMLIPFVFAVWVALLVILLALGYCLIGIINTATTANVAQGVEKKIKTQTIFIKALTVDADVLQTRAAGKSPAIQAEVKKVYEAIRYSDPMTNPALASVEGDISVRFGTLVQAVDNNDEAQVQQIANAILIQLETRNKQIRLLK